MNRHRRASLRVLIARFLAWFYTTGFGRLVTAVLLVLVAGLLWRYLSGPAKTLGLVIASGKSDTWPALVASIVSALSIPLLGIAALLLLILIGDTFAYYAIYRKPYLPVLLGRTLPKTQEKNISDAKKLATLQLVVKVAVEDANQLLCEPLSAWSSDALIQSIFKYMSKQLGAVEGAFKRVKSDVVRAHLMFVSWDDEDEPDSGELIFLTQEDREPLKLGHSVAGRTVLQSTGDARVVANLKNVFYDPDFVPDNPLQSYRALFCIPIVCHFPGEPQPKPYFVFSVDSTIEEAFTEDYITAAKSLAACIGLVGQRFVENMHRDLETKKARAEPTPS